MTSEALCRAGRTWRPTFAAEPRLLVLQERIETLDLSLTKVRVFFSSRWFAVEPGSSYASPVD